MDRLWRRALAAALAGLLVGACSGGGDDADGALPAPSTAAVTTTSVPATTTPPPVTIAPETSTTGPSPACPADPGGLIDLTPDAAVTFARAFVQARAQGVSVAACLGSDAAGAYENRRATVDGLRLCLATCDGGDHVVVTDLDVDPVGVRGDDVQIVSIAVRVAGEAGPGYLLREEVDVALVDGGPRVVAVVPQPVTFVDEHLARLVLEQTLDALAVGEWEHARYVNEGVAAEVEDAAPGILDDPASALSAACAGRACRAPFQLGPISGRDPFVVTIPVVFELADGPLAVDMTVASFEGALTVGQLPPEGRSAGGYVPLARRIFGDSPPSVVLARYDAIEVVRGGSSRWITWANNRFAVDRRVVGDWLVATLERGGPEVVAVDLSTNPVTEVPIDTVELAESAGLVGVGAPGGRPTAVLGDGLDLILHDLVSGERSSIAVAGPQPEEFVGRVDADRDLFLVTTFAGETTNYLLFDWDGVAQPFPPPVGAGVQGAGFLIGPDAFAFDVDDSGSLQSPTSVRLHALPDGAELGRWNLGEEPGVVGVRTADDRWIVAGIVDDGTGALSPTTRYLVIDTETTDATFVDAAASILLPTR